MATRTNSAGLKRDLELLDCIVAGGGSPRSVSELASETKRDKSQVSRALSTLADAGLLERDPDSRGYVVGWRLHTIAAQSLQARIADVSRPHLRKLAATYGETAEVVILRSSETIIIASEASRHALAAYTMVGTTGPAACSATCRAILSTEPPEFALDWLTPERVAEAGTGLAFRTAADFAGEVERVREAGYSIVIDEFEEGVVSCSAPIRGQSGTAIAALGITAPRFRFEHSLTDAAQQVRLVANRVSAEILSGTVLP